MPYSLSYRGQLVGETDFEHDGQHDRQRAGAFRPTDFGLTVMPTLTGFIENTIALNKLLEERGVDSADEGAVLRDIMENTPEGAKVVAYGQMLDELQLRTPTGELLAVGAIAISKWSRLLALAQCRSRANMPEYLISVSLKDDSRAFDGRIVPRMRIRASLN